ncbi:MAG: hypothetical protein AAF986_07865 [Pseudomonadota bacterium]
MIITDTVEGGDILIMFGQARLAYHGIDRLMERATLFSAPPIIGGRLNLTLRRVMRQHMSPTLGD